jgi:hypothetical protein
LSDPLFRITGLRLGEFAAQHWDRRPLFRGAAELPGAGFDDLLTLAAVDELVSRRGLRTPFVRMSQNGDVLSASRFTRSGGAGAEIADQIADDKILHEFAGGATLVLQALHRTWEPIQFFAGALSAQLGHPVQVNAYVTPPQNTGFAPHYDVHDVFVLQFAGRKRWRIFEPVLDAPLRDQPFHNYRSAVEARSAESPIIDRVLESGDTLYLPRGYIHAATSLDGVSGHLTIGVHPVTRRFLADQVLAALSSDAVLRRSLPAGLDLSQERAIEAELATTVAALHAAIDRFDTSAIASAVGRHLGTSTRPAPIGPLEQVAAAATLDANDRVRLRSGLRVAARIDKDAVLELPDREIRVPATQIAALRFATSGHEVSANTLPGIDVSAGIKLLAQLLREGVVVRA